VVRVLRYICLLSTQRGSSSGPCFMGIKITTPCDEFAKVEYGYRKRPGPNKRSFEEQAE
jgi:hypothetical protein